MVSSVHHQNLLCRHILVHNDTVAEEIDDIQDIVSEEGDLISDGTTTDETNSLSLCGFASLQFYVDHQFYLATS